MKEFKKMKKFGAAVTVAAMLGSFSVGVFADEVDPETVEVPEVPAVEESVLPEVPVVEEEPVVAPEEEVSEEAPVVEEEPEADSEEEAPAEEEPAEEDEIVTLADGEDAGSSDGNILIDGSANTSKLQIKSAKANLDKDKKLYTVTLTYEFDSSLDMGTNPQITMLGYIFDGDTETTVAGETTVESSGIIRAIDQKDAMSTGEIIFYLAWDGVEDSAEEASLSDAGALTVSKNAKLVVKLGTDVKDVGGAQAFFIDLANASEGSAGEDLAYGDIDESGEIDITDVGLAFDHAFSLNILDVTKQALADVDGSGEIDITDVGLIFDRAFSINLDPFPVEGK